MGFGGCVECKSYFLTFKILLMLMEYMDSLIGNTVEMAGGEMYSDPRCCEAKHLTFA